MNSVSGGYRLAVAALLALSLHAVILFQQVTYARKAPIVQFRRQITVSLGRQRVTKKQPAVAVQPRSYAKAIKRKQLHPIQTKSKPSHTVAAAARPKPVKNTDIPTKKHSQPVDQPRSKPQPPARQITAKQEFSASRSKAIPAAPRSESTGKQTIRQAIPIYNLNPPPSYPSLAKRRGFEGITILEALVDVAGKVVQVRIFTTSGHRILDKAAVRAVHGWSFTPGSINGVRREMWVKIPLCFQLTEK